jgi:pimeloyl-ACP methyl ester carboxylesterase
VQASDLYTTANAARDVALLLHRLELGKVDYYGDSYATFFGQVLTARYPGLLRSVTLDAAYPVSGKDPFYPHTIQTARRAFAISCDRSVACHRAAPGSAWTRLARLARYLRHHPVTGRTRTPFGRRVTERVTTVKLSEMVNDAGADSGVYRELDPAGRALLRDHDPAPLLRLTQQDVFTGTSGPVREFNDGLYQATTCLDYPQPFRYSQTPRQRAASYRRAVAALPRRIFAPFTVHEWVTEPEEEFDACLDWPAPQHPDPPITTPPPYAPRSLPVLVLSGDLDSLTTPAEGRETARDMGPSARWILVHNDTHVNAMDDTFGCASGLVQTFIADPGGLKRMNASCASRTPEVRVVGSFPTTLSRVTPATQGPRDTAGRTGLRLAAAGAAAVGDAVWRWYYGDGVRGWGLRGGTFRFTGDGSRLGIRLSKVRWTSDTLVGGRVRWNQVSGRIRAWLTVTGPDGRAATLNVSYLDYVKHSRAALSGRYRGKRIAASMPAP